MNQIMKSEFTVLDPLPIGKGWSSREAYMRTKNQAESITEPKDLSLELHAEVVAFKSETPIAQLPKSMPSMNSGVGDAKGIGDTYTQPDATVASKTLIAPTALPPSMPTSTPVLRLVTSQSGGPDFDESSCRLVVDSTENAPAAASPIPSSGTESFENALQGVVEAMNEQYVWLTGPLTVYRINHGDTVPADALRSHYANTSVMIHSSGTGKRVSYFEAWRSSPMRHERVDFDFVPGGPTVVKNHINLWKSWGAEPVSGNIEPWIELLDYVFGTSSTERKWAEQWMAYPIQNPGVKLNTAMVIWSVRQGVGKSLLGETVGLLYGKHFKTISAQELHSQYNGWAQDALFILGEENSGADRRADANKLKQLITGKTVFVNEKYRVARERMNRMNFLFTSNHSDAFHLELHDRRFFVWSIDAAPKDGAFYDRFVKWRDSADGLSALMQHLKQVDLDGFNPHGHAPVTKAKVEMVEYSKTDLERWLSDTIVDEFIDASLGKEIVSLQDLVDLYHGASGSSRTNTTAMGKALRRHCNYVNRRISSPKGRPVVVALRRSEFWDKQDNEAWTREYTKPSGVLL